MLDIIREAPLGQAIRFISRNTLLPHLEEEHDFELPSQYTALLERGKLSEEKDNGAPPQPGPAAISTLDLQHTAMSRWRFSET